MKFLVIFSTITFLWCSQNLNAQTQELDINGLQVIFKPSVKKTVSAIMFYKGGTTNYTKYQQGIEDLTLNAVAACGTENIRGDAYKDLIRKYGISIDGNAGYDFGYVSLTCVKTYFDKGWQLFSECITAPMFNESAIWSLQQGLMAGLKNQESSPDGRLTQMVMTNTFPNTRYAYLPGGKASTLNQITYDDVRAHYKKILNKNNMILVVVGDIDINDLERMVRKSFRNLPEKPVMQIPKPEATNIETNQLIKEKRQLATNYITGIMGAPALNDKDAYAYDLAISILSDKLFEEVRTKRNLSYAPSAYTVNGFIPYSAIYVTTTKPSEAVTVMVDEIKKLRNNGFTETDLKDEKAQYITAYYMKNQSTYSIAYALGKAEIKGSWKKEETFLTDIQNVTLQSMQQVFNKYTHGIIWNYLGNENAIDNAAFDLKIN